MVFSPYISLDLKQRAASRMSDYPATLTGDPILGFAVQSLANFSPFDFLLYYLSVPVGRLQIQVIRLQDHWEVLNWIHSHPRALQPAPRQTYSIDWQKQFTRAWIRQNALTYSNPYGIQNSLWYTVFRGRLATIATPGSADKDFIETVLTSKEWDDLDILLSVLKEEGAQPLILGRPWNGPLLNTRGVSPMARQIFYDRLYAVVHAYGFPQIDFSGQDNNRLFSVDVYSHTSRLGWVYVDQALDAFYHRNIQ